MAEVRHRIRTILETLRKPKHLPTLRSVLKFCASGLTSALLDYVLLFTFKYLTNSLFFSVVAARIISSIYNYNINKILVFQAKNIPAKQSAPKYFILVAIIMFSNYGLLKLLTTNFGVPDTLAKPITDAFLSILSYTVQRVNVFAKKQQDAFRIGE